MSKTWGGQELTWDLQFKNLFRIFVKGLAVSVGLFSFCVYKAKAAEPLAADAASLQLITREQCRQEAIQGVFANQARDLFQNSKLLSIVPRVLEAAQVKDLVPILNEVETKENKSLSDLLMLNQIYEKLGQPEKQVQVLTQAAAAEPQNAKTLFLLASKSLELGQVDQALQVYGQMLGLFDSTIARFYFRTYVLAIEHRTFAFLFFVLFVWGLVLARWRRQLLAKNEFPWNASIQMVLALIVTGVAWRFYHSGEALIFGLASHLTLIMLLIATHSFWSWIYLPLFRLFKGVLGFLFSSLDMARVLHRFPVSIRFFIGILAMGSFLILAPRIGQADLRYLLLAASAWVFYSTVGSLLVAFVRSRETLQSSLTWIALSATLPFLVAYVVANWEFIGLPLFSARWPASADLEGLIHYLVFWGISLLLAHHLGRIIADALVQPLRTMMQKVSKIEKGDFDATVPVQSRDELGQLAQAINRMREGLQERVRLQKSFSKYVDPRVVEKILQSEESQSHVAGTSVEAVVLFADIRGFTSLSEKVSPQEVVKVLNIYFEKMVDIIQSEGGLIDKFIGDAMMAVWGVPSPIDQPEDRAVRAGQRMVKELEALNHQFASQGMPHLSIGIGINSGKVVAGSIGSKDRMEYTVIGDTVNSAQRAESSAQSGQLLLTDQAYAKLTTPVRAQKLEPKKVKGKSEEQIYWAVLPG